MICGICGLDGHLERNGNHASCNALSRKSGRVKASDNGKAINRLSEKGKDIERRYLNRLKTWKKGKIITEDSALAWREGLSFKRVSDPLFRKN